MKSVHITRIAVGAGAVTALLASSCGPVSAAPRQVVIAAAGDIACSPADAHFNGGSGENGICVQLATADAITNQIPNAAAVLALGDLQYNSGTYSEFQGSFAKSWGRFLNRDNPAGNLLWPVPGNHEYYDPAGSANGYYQYFNGGTANAINGSGVAGRTHRGWYSRKLGAWRIIALNSECAALDSARLCGPGSAQYKWLQRTLRRNQSRCTLAYWHKPLFNAGEHAGETSTRPFWKLLRAAHADVVLNGHDHNYQRYVAQSPSGRAQPKGITEFVVGTGGAPHYAVSAPSANLQASNADTHGVLKLTLKRRGYSWEFVRASNPGNGSFTDSGSRACT